MKLCIALDMPDKTQCFGFLKELEYFKQEIWIKVGMRAFYRDGAMLIKELKEKFNFKIFLDLKLYDIPNTMADACEELANLGVDMINLHASAGEEALKTCMKRLSSLQKRPLVLGVSALTSFDEQGFYEIYHQGIKEAVFKFAKMCFKCSLDGMVCSAYESLLIKKETQGNFITLAPGIRPFKEELNDQKRVADLAIAKAERLDFIVVGRPIYQADYPKEVCEKILKAID